LNHRKIRYRRNQLGNGNLAAHKLTRLMLLGSPPDMVHGILLRKTGPSTLLTQARRFCKWSGCGNSPLL